MRRVAQRQCATPCQRRCWTSSMKAMILAAGYGKRLRPLTDMMPIPMIAIASEPLIVHQIRWLRHAGISEIVINLHHLGEQIEDKLGHGTDLGVRITYCHEEELLATGGAIANALPYLLPGHTVKWKKTPKGGAADGLWLPRSAAAAV